MGLESGWASTLVACPAILALLLFATGVAGFPGRPQSERAGTALTRRIGWVTRLTACQAVAALVSLTVWAWVHFGRLLGGTSLPKGDVFVEVVVAEQSLLLYDGVSALMLALVSSIGWVICRFSVRYLHGESGQARYFRWTAITIAAVSWMVIAGNLALFVACWVMTSIGLHHLLLHYPERPAARRAAWTIFIISRFGDVALVTASVVLLQQFGTLDFREMFTLVAAWNADTVPLAANVSAGLLIVGAVTKSAQFPLHTWLPLTMETPTPVSALMHAGIVNAGGYLVIRASPLLADAPESLAVLAIFGAMTLLYAAVVMTTQTSVKKRLAYSTIAQMGFMMLQCGMGAFSAAMLHILAHSAYKAHAFLGSGDAVSDAARMVVPDCGRATESRVGRLAAPARVLVTAIVLVAAMAGAFVLLGIDIASKPGGGLLGSVVVLGLGFWNLHTATRFGPVTWMQTMTLSVALCLVYAASFAVVDAAVVDGVGTLRTTTVSFVLSALILFAIIVGGVLQVTFSQALPTPWLHEFRIHAGNGFYVESLIRRLATPLHRDRASSKPSLAAARNDIRNER